VWKGEIRKLGLKSPLLGEMDKVSESQVLVKAS